MDPEGDSRQKQEDELIALRSILIDGIEDLRTSTRGQDGGTSTSVQTTQRKRDKQSGHQDWKPLELLIDLEPQESYGPGKEIYVQAQLYLKCGPNYPHESLETIQIRPIKGLSKSLADHLSNELILEAKKNKGVEVIWTLVNMARIFLSDHNKPGPKSFYEEMERRQRKEIEEREKEKVINIEEKMKEEEDQKRLLEEQVEKKRHVLKSELRRDSSVNEEESTSGKGESTSGKKESTNGKGESTSGKGESTSGNYDEPCSIIHNRSSVRQLDTKGEEILVGKLRCNYHDPVNNSISYECLIVDHGRDTGQGQSGPGTGQSGLGTGHSGLVILTEWTIDLKTLPWSKLSQVDENRMKPQEVRQLASLHHAHLLIPLGVGCSIENQTFTMSISHERIDGIRLSDSPFIWKGAPLTLQVIKLYSRQILEGLDYIHSHSLDTSGCTKSGQSGCTKSGHLSHGDLKHSNIIIRTNGQVKITGLVWDRKVVDIYNDMNGLSSETKRRSCDLYRFGLIFMWMSSGWKQRFEDLVKVEDIPEPTGSRCSVNFVNEILSCVSRGNEVLSRGNESSVTAQRLLNHSFLSLKTDGKSPVTFQDEVSGENDLNLPADYCLHKSPATLLLSGQSSRVINDFLLIDTLGKGAFGIVYKVKHRLDQRYLLSKLIKKFY